MHNKMHQDEETFVSISPDKPGSARVVRAEAFAVCGQIVEEVKKRLPVWKRQTFTDGTAQWSNLA